MPRNAQSPQNFVRTIDTQMLVNMLADLSVPGSVVTYVEMNEALGRNVQSEARGNLQSARNIALAEFGKVFRIERNVGLVLLSEEEKVKRAPRHVKRIHNAAKRAKSELATVDLSELSPTGKNQFNVVASQVTALHHMTSLNSTRRLADAVSNAQQQLPLAKTLAAFK